MLSVSGLTKKFEGLSVMDGFDLTIRRGGFTTLIGPSGCGKSTLFDVLTGVFPRDSGRISWLGLGEEISDLMGKAAYMQQKDLLLPWLSLIDNAILPATIRTTRAGRPCPCSGTWVSTIGVPAPEGVWRDAPALRPGEDPDVRARVGPPGRTPSTPSPAGVSRVSSCSSKVSLTRLYTDDHARHRGGPSDV